jgi:hypothetical protein
MIDIKLFRHSPNQRQLEPGEVEATARAYNTRAEIMPDLAHDMMLEERWEVVAARIIEWLRQQRF